MKQPDVYYFETIKMMSKPSKILHGECEPQASILCELCFIIYLTTAKTFVVCRNNAKVVQLKVHVLQLLNVYKSLHNVSPRRHETHAARQKC